VQSNHSTSISSHGNDLEESIKNIGKQDEKYQQLKEKLHQGSQGNEGKDYFLSEKGFIKFKNKIYVLNSSDLKKLILKQSHAKTYSSHHIYQKTLVAMKTFYWW